MAAGADDRARTFRSTVWPTLRNSASILRVVRSVTILATVALLRSHAGGADAGADRFERDVRPLLIERCQKCHAEEKAEGGLRLDSRAALERGGDSGPAINPRRPLESLLIRAVTHADGLKMPPDGRLEPRQIDDLIAWVAGGAIWPAESDAKALPPAARQPPIHPLSPDSPSLAGSLQLWLKADALPLDDGAAVPVWPDSSGHGRDVSATKGVRSDGHGLPGLFVRESTLARRPGGPLHHRHRLRLLPRAPHPGGGGRELDARRRRQSPSP